MQREYPIPQRDERELREEGWALNVCSQAREIVDQLEREKKLTASAASDYRVSLCRLELARQRTSGDPQQSDDEVAATAAWNDAWTTLRGR